MRKTTPLSMFTIASSDIFFTLAIASSRVAVSELNSYRANLIHLFKRCVCVEPTTVCTGRGGRVAGRLVSAVGPGSDPLAAGRSSCNLVPYL